jgi:cysteine desulfurase
MSAAARSRPIYLDYAATTPLDPRVSAVMAGSLADPDGFGNPASTTHAYGRRAAAQVATARAQVAALVGADPEHVCFTSGATEAINLALLGSARAAGDLRRHVVTARTEHRATLDACARLERDGFEVTYLVPGPGGIIASEAVAAALRDDTLLVSLMHVNNETGGVQDLAAIAAYCRTRGARLHGDAAQSAGRLPLDVTRDGIDLLSLSAHKLYGPKGIGALIVAPAARPWIAPILHGGGQERGLRPGTLATHQILGFGAACAIAQAEAAGEAERLAVLRARLWSRLQSEAGALLNGDAARCVPGILNVSFDGVDGESLLAALPGLAVSSGAACASASGEPSYVLKALGRSAALTEASLRLSFGRFSTEADIEEAARTIVAAVSRLRALAP